MTEKENFDAAREARAQARDRVTRGGLSMGGMRRMLDAAFYRDAHSGRVRKPVKNARQDDAGNGKQKQQDKQNGKH